MNSPASVALVERLAFLAAAGETLASSLDYAQTLQEVARLALPILGDMCIVDVFEHGSLNRVATSHVNPAKVGLLHELRTRFAPSPESPQPAARVMRTGAVELIARITPEIVTAHTTNPDHARLIQALGVRSHLAVPLSARGITLGVIGFGITESDRIYGADDVALAQDLARRAALAIDNARLYRLAQAELQERRRAEQALRLSESRFRAIFEQSPLSMQILAPTGETIRVNQAWQALWGATIEAMKGYNMLQDPQLEAAGILPLLRRAFEGEAQYLPEVHYDPNETLPDPQSHSYSARVVSAFAYPVRDTTSTTVREVVLVHQDVTETRRHQEQLRLSEERLRLALVAGRMNVWSRDLLSGGVETSSNAADLWGVEIRHIDDLKRVVHPDDVASIESGTTASMASGDGSYSSEYRVLLPSGDIRWLQSRGRVQHDARGRAARLLGVTLDITGLKLAEETTRLLADAGGTLGTSLDSQTTLQNFTRLLVPRFADWCTVDLLSDEGTLKRVAVAHQDPSRLKAVSEAIAPFATRRSDARTIWRVIESAQPEWSADVPPEALERIAHDARHLQLLRSLQLRSFICAPLVARGQVIGVLMLVYAGASGRRYKASDVPVALDLGRRAAVAVENAQLYQRLRTEDRRKDEFLATLAHELRNPLAPIRTGLALLATSDAAAAERTRQVMERQLAHLVRLVDDLLDLSRVTRDTVQLERERTDLVSLVGSAMEASRPFIDTAGVQLRVHLPDAPVVLDVDRTRISQVLSNLLNNAAKYTDTGGLVELDAVEQGDVVCIRVHDSGIGIPRPMLERIFEMFTQVDHSRTRSHGGLGIGLTLVRRLVELHGGRAWAESEGPGQGSTFYVELPRVAAASTDATPRAPSAGEETTAGTRRVLVVDDNRDAAELLAALLSFDGHDVRTACSGPEALNLVQNFVPQVAFLDIGLPGMSGYELAQRLRALPQLSATLLVAVTGWGQEEDRRQSREAGLDHHLTKPVDPDEILRLLAELPH